MLVQNPRMVEVGKDLWRSCGPTPVQVGPFETLIVLSFPPHPPPLPPTDGRSGYLNLNFIQDQEFDPATFPASMEGTTFFVGSRSFTREVEMSTGPSQKKILQTFIFTSWLESLKLRSLL